MSDSSEQNRSEAPSPFKLQKARREGSVARGADLGFVGVLAAATGLIWFQGRDVVEALQLLVARGLAATGAEPAGLPGFLTVAAQLFAPIASTLLVALMAVFCVVALMEFLQTGPVFAPGALRLNLGRLNPATGLKRVFTPRILIEAFKSVLKIVFYGALAGLVVHQALRLTITIENAEQLGAAVGRLTFRLVACAAGAALIIAILDQAVARRDFLKKMRMSRRELRREHRDREGDPRLKQKRKELHDQFARTSQSLRGIRSADMLIANPIHFAVALRYRPELMDAPVVVSRGAHALALRLRRIAFAYDVPVVIDPILARRLYAASTLNQPIPEDLFQPVADVYLRRRRKAENMTDA